MPSRLTGCCRKIIQKGSGALGEREANLFNSPSELIGFQLNKDLEFHQLYNSKTKVTANTHRNEISVQIPESRANEYYKIPKKATHYQLTAVISYVSKLQWQPQRQAYQPTHPEHHTLGGIIESQPLALNTTHHHLNLQWQKPTPKGHSNRCGHDGMVRHRIPKTTKRFLPNIQNTTSHAVHCHNLKRSTNNQPNTTTKHQQPKEHYVK